MKQATGELGNSKWDTATGSIAGVIVAVVILSLTFGVTNLDGLDWPVFAVPVLIGGVAGFFFGKSKDHQHFVKVRNRAFEIDGRNERSY